MDFTPTDDQEELRASVRAVLARACPPSAVRHVFEGKDGEYVPSRSGLWKQMVDLDWPALTIPEQFGGIGLGFVELSLVVEELGRVVAPSPFLATVTQFAPLVREVAPADRAEPYLRAIAERGATGTVALAEAPGTWDPGRVTTTARPVDGGWVLDGTKSWVCDGVGADHIAVVARAEHSSGTDGLGVFVVPGDFSPGRVLPVFDPTQPLVELVFDSVMVPADAVLAEPGREGVHASITRALEETTACLAASTCGSCRVIFETTLQYAKDREQYGQPIGSFQALKHRLVEMYLLLERASALSAYAALTIAEDDERRSVAVAMAKAAAGDCQRLLVQDGIQLHGGIGFTWENDLHMFAKRAKTNDFLFGGARTHRAAVARQVGVWT
ncbi:MAG TPA: acyl-CoA dehydrogenase family protein [Acidimicrobiales bacterium]|jgi:alkylation response protein AidB-like acyl-CoA dehydrogenase|nr:acyl-CoA dehydrogenase family protein [Acidimicrobiales bacterium]